jgi:hypothetical protein
MVHKLRILDIRPFSTRILWPSRLFPRSRSVQDLRRHSEALPLQQHPVADDSSARIAHDCARHQQLRQRVGEALASVRMLQHVVFFVICGVRSPHAPQVLHSGSDGGMGETSGAEAGDDDERSKRAVMMTPA